MGIEFSTIVRASYHGQIDLVLIATLGNLEVGSVEYSVYKDKPYIQMIRVPEAQRRKGYATQLILELQRQFPEVEINFGGLTEDGKHFYDSLPKKTVRSEYADLIEEHSLLQIKVEKIMSQVAQQYEGRYLSDDDRARYFELTAPLNELNDRIFEIEQQVVGKSATKTLIDTTIKIELNLSLWVEGALQGDTPIGDAQTVTVDGKERPALNSNGKPIHPTIEGVRNFWRWFGDSEVVDGQSRPLVVYHGTNAEFTEFSSEFIGDGNGNADWGDGFYFGSTPGIANSYANSKGANVIPAYLSINKLANKSVMMSERVQGVIDDDYFETPIEVLGAMGYEGIVIDHGKGEMEYVAFRSDQIKSAISHARDFDLKDEDVLLQSAFHGSPHRFERFDLRKIGTGEGSQSYGWGQYFADSKDVADGYRVALTIEDAYVGGELLNPNIPMHYLAQVISDNSSNSTDDVKNIEDVRSDLLERSKLGGAESVRALAKAALELLEAGERPVLYMVKPQGQLYAVNIPDEVVDRMLDRDKPLSEQSDFVRGALNLVIDQRGRGFTIEADVTIRDGSRGLWRIGSAYDTEDEAIADLKNMTGAQLYTKLARVSGARETSRMLNSIGIPGLRYLDGNSRSDGDGTRNTVVWDQALLDQISDEMETFYQFAGEHSKEADLFALSTAKQRLAAGEDSERVRVDTGWFMGPDGKWRYEISDADAKQKPQDEWDRQIKERRRELYFLEQKVDSNKLKGKDLRDAKKAITRAQIALNEATSAQGTVGYVLDHPKLFAAYPHIAAIQLHFDANFDKGNAYYDDAHGSKRITIGAKGLLKDESFLSSLLHEIQHAIQDKENFAIGGMPFDSSLPTDIEFARQINNQYAELKAQIKGSPEYIEFTQNFIRSLPDSERYVFTRRGEKLNEPLDVSNDLAENAAYEKFLLPIEEGRRQAVSAFLDAGNSVSERFAVYRYLAGEVEARNTQARQKLNEQERLEIAPSYTSDVKDDDVIVLVNGQKIHPRLLPANLGNLSVKSNLPVRGSFNPNTNTIALLENADLSTFLHEAGHFFLEVQFDLASRLQNESRLLNLGERSIINDVQALVDWFGLDSIAAWKNLTVDQKRPYHERFARGFEAYLFEGKAPSKNLQNPFKKFSTWLVGIYRDFRNLNVNLNDSVRGVMDRMLGSSTLNVDAEMHGEFQELLTSQFRNAGLFSNEVSDAYAALMHNFYLVNAEQIGISAMDMYRRYPFNIAGPRSINIQNLNPSQPAFDGPETGNTPIGDAQTVNVDGVERTVFNANGKPIHPTLEGVRNFWRWFGDSKVVDSEGRPLVVYHGTDGIFNEFSLAAVGQSQDGKLFYGEGFYFSSSDKDANAYGKRTIVAYLRSTKVADLRRGALWRDVLADQKPRGQELTLGEITKRYKVAESALKIQDVFVEEVRPGFFDIQWKIAGEWRHRGSRSPLSRLELQDDPTGYLYAKNQALPINPDRISLAEFNPKQITDAAVSKGYDAIIGDASIGALGDEYVVFSPNQIKSATGNAGTFDLENPNILMQSVFHGSPHDFDNFTLDAIGTGEGAEAYGWGLYFAGKKEVAEWYRRQLTNGASWRNKAARAFKDDDSRESDFASAAYYIADLRSEGLNVAQVKQRARSLNDGFSEILDDPEFEKFLGVSWTEIITNTGQLYEVNIPEDDTMLLWDKLLSEQPEKVREALTIAVKKVSEQTALNTPIKNAIDRVTNGRATGADLYNRLAHDSGPYDGKAASKYLNSLGISGIKYLDGSSRSEGYGNYNYVIFDDKDVKILKSHYGQNMTIDVDGKERSILNSNGQRIHATEEGILNFWRWFGDSKTVDAEGRPLVLYHGTSADFDVFETSKEGIHLGTAAQANMRVSGQGKNLMPVYLKINDWQRSKDLDGKWASKVKAAKAAKKDGIVYLNRYEGINYETIERAEAEGFSLNKASDTAVKSFASELNDSYIVFSGAQIKSAIGNSGLFASDSNSLTDQLLDLLSIKTITVDGKERSRFNSNGQLIHPTENGIRNFWRWFGDSKVVDSEGRPLVVYHGTTDDFSKFDGKATGVNADYENLFFFAQDPDTASTYADHSDGNVLPVYLKALNPVDRRHVYNLRESRDSAIQKMLEEDRDSAFFNDSNQEGRAGGVAWTVRSPDQIKSAIGNSGAFDPNNSSITDHEIGKLFKLNTWDDVMKSETLTVQAVQELIEQHFPGLIEGMSGQLSVVQRDSDLPPHLRHSGEDELRVAAVYDTRTQKTYFVADHINKDEVRGLVLHEIGVHAGLRRLLGGRIDPLMSQVKQLLELNDPAMLAAARKVPVSTADADFHEEVLAYYVQDMSNYQDSIFQRCLSKARGFLFACGANVALSPVDMYFLASGAVTKFKKRSLTKIFTSISKLRALTARALSKVTKEAGSPKYAFAGQRAGTARHAMLNKAIELARAGSAKEEILSETGWFQGPDSAWRYEIDDKGASLSMMRSQDLLGVSASNWVNENSRGLRVADLFTHTALFEAYPELKNYHVVVADLDGQRLGCISMHGKTIYLSSRLQGHEVIPVCLHELQHAIQAIEKFSSSVGFNSIKAAFPEIERNLAFYIERAEQSPKIKDACAELAGYVQSCNPTAEMISRFEKDHLIPKYDEYEAYVDVKEAIALLEQYGPGVIHSSLLAEIEANGASDRRYFDEANRAAYPFNFENTFLPQAKTILLREGEDIRVAYPRAVLGNALAEDQILVNGKIRPKHDSNGDLLALTDDGLINFWNWFGDSTIVDGYGRPIPQYHGSPYRFDAFKELSQGIHVGGRTQAEVALVSKLGHIDLSEYEKLLQTENQAKGYLYKVYARVNTASELHDARTNSAWAKQVTKARLSGAEAIHYQNEYEGHGDSWILFNREQIWIKDVIDLAAERSHRIDLAKEHEHFAL